MSEIRTRISEMPLRFKILAVNDDEATKNK